MADARYHVRFADPESGEELGLLLTEAPALGFSRRLVNPYAAKASKGATQDQDLTEWSMLSQRDWRGGRGQEEMADASAFYDSWNVETRIEKQVTLGPLPQNPTGALPVYEPGSATWYYADWPGPAVQVDTSASYLPVMLNQGASMRFVARRTRHISSVEVRIKKAATTSGVITLALYSESGGLPGTSLGSKAVAAASVSTSWSWITFTFDAAVEVTEGYCWVVLTTEDAAGYAWNAITYRPDPVCYVASKLSGSWSRVGGTENYTLTYKAHYAGYSRSMSFVCPDGGITCTTVQLWISVANSCGQLYVRLYANSGGKPTGAALATKTVEPTWTYGWYEVIFEASAVLTGGQTYHIAVEPVAEDSQALSYERYFIWGGNSSGGYATGGSCRKIGSGSWTACTEDLYFRVNRNELDGAPVAFARYDDEWYCAAGDTVYVWDDGWTTSDHVHTKDVTSLEMWGGYLWAGRGSSNVLRKFNGSEWAAVTGVYANLLKAGGGYLHLSNGEAGHEHEMKYTADGTEWSDAIEIGAGDQAITAMAWYRDMLVCANAISLWGVAAEMGYPLVDWASQEDAHNGVGMLTWGKTGCLYIPLRFGLYRWNGDSMSAIGPEQGMGLPGARSGYINALVGTNNWLFAAVNAGSAGTSSILAYSGMGGWHEMQRADKANQAVGMLGFEVLSSPARLWYGVGSETRYLLLPDYSDNPYQWTGYEFNAQGELELSWYGGDLLEVVKDLHEVVIRGEGLASGQTVAVYYEIDRSGMWTYLGLANAGTRVSLQVKAATFGKRTIGDGSTTTTIELASGHTTEGMAAGDWVRINEEVRQVSSVTDSDTFVLVNELSAAPASDDVVYASRPAGREFRFKVVLSTNDNTLTPKVKAIIVRYQNNVLDRFIYALQVRVADGMVDLAGNPYPYSAATLRSALDDWVKRVCQFTLCDPDGAARTVKVVSVGEGGYTREQGASPIRYGSVYSINLVEVA